MLHFGGNIFYIGNAQKHCVVGPSYNDELTPIVCCSTVAR